MLSNRPVTEIAREDTLRRLQIGLDNFLLPQRIGADLADTVRDDPFRSAFVRLQNQQGLYRESGTAVTFLTPTVFRAAIPMPAAVSTGTYGIDVQLFSGGMLVARTNTALEVIKTGFRAICRRRRARLWAALRPGNRLDGAADRLVRQPGFRARLVGIQSGRHRLALNE